MKKIFSIFAAAITPIFSICNASAYSLTTSNMGESSRNIYILLGIMAAALVAVVILVVIRSRNKNK